MNNLIIAIVGMCGSGKSELSDYFVDSGFKRVYFGDVTIREIKSQGLLINETNEKHIRENLRSKFGKAAYAIKLLPDIQAVAKTSNVVLDGLYSWSEYKYLKEHFGANLIILAIVTNQEIRQERLSKRPVRPLTLNEVENRDMSEIENLEKGGPIARADYYIVNNGTKENLQKQYEEFIKWIQNQDIKK